MRDDRLIDVYDVTTGRLLDKLSQWEALKRILIHERIQPDTKTIERNRYKIYGVLTGNPVAYFNLLYCCTEYAPEPEPERVPMPMEILVETCADVRECPNCKRSGLTEVSCELGWGHIPCHTCRGAGNLD